MVNLVFSKFSFGGRRMSRRMKFVLCGPPPQHQSESCAHRRRCPRGNQNNVESSSTSRWYEEELKFHFFLLSESEIQITRKHLHSRFATL